VDSKRIYRIAPGDHALKVERVRHEIRHRSSSEKAFWGATATAINVASSLTGAGPGGASSNVSDTSVSVERFVSTLRFTAAVGEAYVFDGYAILPKQEP